LPAFESGSLTFAAAGELKMKSSSSPTQILISLLLVFLNSTNPVRAFHLQQDLDNATITGRVMDQNGAVIPGAEVSAILAKTGTQRSTITDTEGRYRLFRLQPGNYVVRASCIGFEKRETNDLTAIAGQTLQLDLTLTPESLAANSVVIAANDTPIVDTTRTVVGATITSRELDSIPIAGRSPLDLVFTLPGVSEEPLSTRDLAEDRNSSPANTPEEAGIFALAGAPAYSNNLTIDGLDNNDDRAARERFLPPLDAVEEVQVITNQFSAEYGRASGGRVNLQTRSGSNHFRARAFYYFRDEALNANTLRNNSLGLSRLPLQEHNFGFTLSGPSALLHRKLARTFFFTGYEHNRVLDTALVDTLVPLQQNPLLRLPRPTLPQLARLESVTSPAIATEIAPYVSSVSTPLKNTSLLTRIDHEFSQSHNGSLVYQLGRLHNLRQFGGGNRLAETLLGKIRNSNAISYTHNYVVSSRLVIQTRLQYSRLAPTLIARDRQAPVVLIAINDSLESNDPAVRSGTLVAGSSTAGATDRSEARIQFQELLTAVNGNHSVTVGLDAQRIRSTFIDLSDVSGTFNFASAGDFLTNTPSRFRQNFLGSSTQRTGYLGVFAQDQWRPSPNLTIGLGVRYESELIVSDRNNFGPRFSVAYDPFNSAKTVLRFGFGVFYNRVLLRTIDDFTVGAKQLFFDTNTLRDPVSGNLFSADQRRAFIAANLQFPHTLVADSPLVKQFGVLNSEFSRRLDQHLRIPESYQANIGFERDLGRGFAVEANFTFTRGLHLWREFNANAPVLPVGYRNFTDYLASRDFPNFRPLVNGVRPLYNSAGAGELVRFVLSPPNPTSPNSVATVIEFGVPVSLINLNSFTSATAVDVALAALNQLRPDPRRAEIEQLISAGNSFYKGLTIDLRRRVFGPEKGFVTTFRAAYTFSHLIDDGIVNTSDALMPGDFHAERARSLLDRRHRFVFSGTVDLPSYLGKLRMAPLFRLTSGAPFNISLAGADRNLDDVGNDRPMFSGDLRLLRSRAQGTFIDDRILRLFALPAIGQSGNLPRNAGSGPGQFFLDLNVTREFRISERARLRASIEFDNVLNKTVFSFGSEFINFSALAPNASAEQRQKFLDSFLVTTRTLRPRQVRLGLKFDF